MSAPLRFLPPNGSDQPEIDRVSGAPHPREALSLLGHEDAEAAFLTLYNSGKMHHAFLLTGPEGVGKASFAYRAARFLLAEGEREGSGFFGDEAPATLEISPESRTAHLVANDAHPDLSVLRRRYDSKTKKFKTEISVDDTRETLTLFEKTAAFGGWRAIIVDAADDLNNASANALLKTLEEPPRKAIFFLVAHQPQRLLPTIRSRCRLLSFAPLPPEHLRRIVGAIRPGGVLDEAGAAGAEGSVRKALRLADPGLRAYLAAIADVLGQLPKRRHGEIDRIAESCRTGAEGEQALSDLLEAIETWLRASATNAAAAGDVSRAAAFADFWARMRDDAMDVDAYNLDRRAFVITLFDRLAALVSGAPR